MAFPKKPMKKGKKEEIDAIMAGKTMMPGPMMGKPVMGMKKKGMKKKGK